MSPPGISGTASRTDSMARAIRRSASTGSRSGRSAIDSGAPAGEPEAADGLDVQLAVTGQGRDLVAREALDVDALVGVTVGRSVGEAGCQKEVHHLGRVSRGERCGGQRPDARGA